MSTYTPGTILSFGFGPTLEQVIVLTEGKVATKTFGGHPVTRRDIMSLSDWCILAKSLGQEIQADYIPVPVVESLPESVAELVAESVAESVPESYPVGTKLSWKHPDGASEWYSPNRRTAIVVKNGILQVKEVIDGTTSMSSSNATSWAHDIVAQKFFSSVADWKATLPAGGSVTITEATEDYSIPSIKRKAAKSVEATTDAGYIKELQQRFTVLSKLEAQLTPTQKRNEQVLAARNLATVIHSYIKNLNTDAINMSISEITDVLTQTDAVAKRLRRATRKAAAIQIQIALDPSSALTSKFYFKNNYKQRLMAFVGGQEVQICTTDGFIALSGTPSIYSDHTFYYPKVATNFADLGIDMKPDGKPRLKVYYRRESIEV